ncbi:RsmF rRNA methyltransferase first C-terminal domain-containing protein [Dubosiella newyorkensis]|uniref:RsmF rRNA methyltransferase first C-terminal domain-containing protein n=1 Tax=Dubosiella newyorkensis TaxID=1862672 RepID=UPI00272D8ECC|nr:RsmF rRNA methyltransferase first C-terminal domain-containing protein [Dubosiella newyorkensis]
MNDQFLERMKSILADDYPQFLDSLERPFYKGVRLNPKKCEPEALVEMLRLTQPTPFYRYEYYNDSITGLNPFHCTGSLYLQEPSASSVVPLLGIQPNDLVLDLCAAPGSKSTQILDFLETGFLVSNEIHPKRAQVLLSNMERMGAVNFAVTNSDPKTIGSWFPACFDKVLVDAPCSGEGMIKKHEEVKEDWSLENIDHCASRQKEILPWAIKALKSGGELVYSTCTYAIEENEAIVAWILEHFPEMEQVEIHAGFGRKGVSVLGMDPSKVVRITPIEGGEGQFVAKFRKKGSDFGEPLFLKNQKLNKKEAAFFHELTRKTYPYILKKDEKIFGMDHPFIDFGKIKTLRQGVLMGEQKKGRIEPEHAFFLAADQKEGLISKVEIDEEEMDRFMHGEVLMKNAAKGYVALCFKQTPFGFGKSDGNRITNKLPKGLRFLPKSHLSI